MKQPVVMSVFFFFLLSCTLPRIYVVEDPLTAAQHNELGFIYENQGEYDLAKKEYTLALKKRKDWALPCFNLGNLYYKMGEKDRAEAYYRKALEKDPVNPDAMNNLAYVLFERGRYVEAEKWIGRALSIQVKEEYLDTQKKIFSNKVSGEPALP